jgi:membrane-associated phospholipid phosphatase
MLVYEEARGVAHILSPHPYYAPQLDIDRALFGTVPTTWLQQHLWDGTLNWWEQVLSLLTRLHFIVPPTILFVVWLRDRARYYRYAATILAVSFAGVVGFALWPAAPPWMAAEHGWIPPVVRIDYLQIAAHLGSSSHSFVEGHLLRNEAAAVPSLHAAYAMLVVLICFDLDRRLGLASIAYAAGMWFAIVYFGEHYVSDALIGIALAVAGWLVVRRLIRRTRLAGPFQEPLAHARAGPEPSLE